MVYSYVVTRDRSTLTCDITLTCQITELARFRETRPPEHDAWGTPEFLNKHRQSVWDISEEADAAFVETLQRNLRSALRHRTMRA